MKKVDVETKPELVGGDALKAAVLQAAMPEMNGEDRAVAVVEKAEVKRRVSPKNGVAPPATGRPKGVRNKLTTVREAVMEAFHQVGGPAYLVRLAEGTQSDRAAFTSLLNKVLPTQINADVQGGIKLELSWLGQRAIGTTTAQNLEPITQVVDLERDSKGKYRIADQQRRTDADDRQASGGAGDAQGDGT